jgi:hypothetical protein
LRSRELLEHEKLSGAQTRLALDTTRDNAQAAIQAPDTVDDESDRARS